MIFFKEELHMDITSIINAFFTYASLALFVVGVLTALTNIVVEVFKGLFPKLPTAILVFVISVALTALALLIACSVLEITVMWYYGAGALILGIVVAYAAMGNFDKLKEIVERLQAYKSVR